MPYNPNIHHRRSIRLKDYDYSQAGLYFITICVQNRECVFGKIADNKMILNKYGKIAYGEWLKTPDMRPNIQLDEFIVMPNHIHGIIVITDNDGDGGGRGVLHTPLDNNDHTPRDENTPCDHDHTPLSKGGNGENGSDLGNRGVCNTPLRSPSNTIGAIIRGYKSAVTKQIHELGFSDAIWQRNYHEHIIRNEQSYQNIVDYIIHNPEKWQDDKFYLE
jgi:REP element-mobilizing transposase RayT